MNILILVYNSSSTYTDCIGYYNAHKILNSSMCAVAKHMQILTFFPSEVQHRIVYCVALKIYMWTKFLCGNIIVVKAVAEAGQDPSTINIP